jgi:hypothetical protein
VRCHPAADRAMALARPMPNHSCQAIKFILEVDHDRRRCELEVELQVAVCGSIYAPDDAPVITATFFAGTDIALNCLKDGIEVQLRPG